MYSQEQTVGSRAILKLIAVVMLLLAGLPFAYAQSTDSSGDAKPVLPASSDDSGKNVAKATSLPSTDTPATRVANVRPDTYIIGADDVLAINVWKEGELSKTVPVRPDGMITLPLVGEIKAVGLTPIQLQEQIIAALQKVMSDPQVTVMVSAVNSMSYNIVGQVAKPGFYSAYSPHDRAGCHRPLRRV